MGTTAQGIRLKRVKKEQKDTLSLLMKLNRGKWVLECDLTPCEKKRLGRLYEMAKVAVEGDSSED